jgi:hypothetical protein
MQCASGRWNMKVGVVVAADMYGQTKDGQLKESDKSSPYMCAGAARHTLANMINPLKQRYRAPALCMPISLCGGSALASTDGQLRLEIVGYRIRTPRY